METINLFRNSCDFKAYKPGEIIFEQGDEADNMYVVQEGEVEIVIKGKVVETATEGHIFGEMALIDKKDRSATVRAKTECKVVPIDKKRFTYLVQETPFFALHVMKVMANRIRNMDSLL